MTPLSCRLLMIYLCTFRTFHTRWLPELWQGESHSHYEVLGVLLKYSHGRNSLNADAAVSKRGVGSMQILPRSSVLDSCIDPFLAPRSEILTRDGHAGHARRQIVETQGYTTTDDFGTDGDDTVHSTIPSYSYPDFFQGTAAFPSDGSDPDVVDLIFID
jgi:hypothetical protein